jgi:recombination protein RecA
MIDAVLLKDLEGLGTKLVANYERLERLPSGSLAFDAALGGGLPRGRFTMISGPEGSGKSSLALLAAIRTRRDGGMAAVIDVERRFSVEFAHESGLGVPGKDYLLLYPAHAEGALETIRRLTSQAVDLCILDSIAALAPKAEIEGDMEDQQMGLLARLMGKFFRSATDEIAASGMAVLLTNQLREKIGVIYGSPVVRPGGRSKDFYASIAIDTQTPTYEYLSGEDAKSKRNPIGMSVNGRTYKNVTAPNFIPFEVAIRFSPALHCNRPAEIFDFALRFGLFAKKDGTPVQASTASCHFEGVLLGTGRAAVERTLAEELDVQEAVENAVRQAITNRQGVFSQNGSEGG